MRKCGGEDLVYCKDGHPHHWILGRGNKPKSLGVCRLCGAEALFTNGYDTDKYTFTMGIKRAINYDEEGG